MSEPGRTATRRASGLATVLLCTVPLVSCGGPKATESKARAEPTVQTGATSPVETSPRGFAELRMVETPSPAGEDAAWPRSFVGADGRLHLSWVQTTSDGHALRFASHADDGWSEPREVYASDHLFYNWADFPSIVATSTGSLVAHWLEKRPGGTYAYDARYRWSGDGGGSWAAPGTLHDDGTATEHGFVSMVPLADGRVVAVWLDGREMSAGDHDDHGHGGGDMTLRAGVIAGDGTLTSSRVLDARVCECCGTDAVQVDDAVLVVFRDRSDDEVRDIGAIRIGEGADSDRATSVHDDGWKIEGCPVNGPAVAANGSHAVVAWFSSADSRSRVEVAFSSDGGRTFATPVEVAGVEALGRVDVALVDETTAVVSWLEDGVDEGRVMVRQVTASGERSDATAVATTSTARRSGFPRLVSHGDGLFVAWTEAVERPRVRTGVIELHRAGGAN